MRGHLAGLVWNADFTWRSLRRLDRVVGLHGGVDGRVDDDCDDGCGPSALGGFGLGGFELAEDGVVCLGREVDGVGYGV